MSFGVSDPLPIRRVSEWRAAASAEGRKEKNRKGQQTLGGAMWAMWAPGLNTEGRAAGNGKGEQKLKG